MSKVHTFEKVCVRRREALNIEQARSHKLCKQHRAVSLFHLLSLFFFLCFAAFYVFVTIAMFAVFYTFCASFHVSFLGRFFIYFLSNNLLFCQRFKDIANICERLWLSKLLFQFTQ